MREEEDALKVKIVVEDKNYKVPEGYIDQTKNEDYVFYEKE